MNMNNEWKVADDEQADVLDFFVNLENQTIGYAIHLKPTFPQLNISAQFKVVTGIIVTQTNHTQ